MRCRERHNPFTQLGKDLFACHLYQAYLRYWFAPRRAHQWRYNSDVSRVLMVSSEAAPYAKTGGLADVVGAVPAALQELGDEVAVVLPRYASIDLKAARRVWENLRIHLGLGGFDVTIQRGLRANVGGLFGGRRSVLSRSVRHCVSSVYRKRSGLPLRTF